MRELYLVQWESGGKRKWVKRLNVKFDSESDAAFSLRYHVAKRRRDEVGCGGNMPATHACDPPASISITHLLDVASVEGIDITCQIRSSSVSTS